MCSCPSFTFVKIKYFYAVNNDRPQVYTHPNSNKINSDVVRNISKIENTEKELLFGLINILISL
jgi:hypothetical protein